MRTVIEIEALRLAIARGDDAGGSGNSQRAASMRRHIQRTGNEFHEGAPDFDRLHKGFTRPCWRHADSKRLLTAHSDLYDQAYAIAG